MSYIRILYCCLAKTLLGSASAVRGWSCICACMCAEWEQGHSRGHGFLSERHLYASRLMSRTLLSPRLLLSPLHRFLSAFPPPHVLICTAKARTLVSNLQNQPRTAQPRLRAGETCALLVFDRRIRKTNGPAKWHFKRWISLVLASKHQPSYQAVKPLGGEDTE